MLQVVQSKTNLEWEETMSDIAREVKDALRQLIGLKLSIARNAGNMKVFHFGSLRREEPRRLVGEYALHISCPWRLEQNGRIITGWSDYFTRADDNDDEDWEIGCTTGHLQNQILAALLRGFDSQTRSYVNETEEFVVENVGSDQFGGLQIGMTGSYRLVILIAGSKDEYWRLLRPSSKEPQFVVSGDGIERE